MFSLPNAKRIRRDDLNSPASSPRSSPDPAITELLRSCIQQEYTFAPAPTDTDTQNNGEAVEEDEDGAELRLFALSKAPSQKIRINSPEAGEREAGFVVPHRPPGYYFTGELDGKRREEVEKAAVEGEMVLEWAKRPWAGCKLPWKVMVISSEGLKKEVVAEHPEVFVEERVRRKCRVGKKRRIAMRKMAQTVKSREDEEQRRLKEKEEALREKKTRLNREKKVKKKARDKAKKVAGGDQAEADGDEGEIEG